VFERNFAPHNRLNLRFSQSWPIDDSAPYHISALVVRSSVQGVHRPQRLTFPR